MTSWLYYIQTKTTTTKNKKNQWTDVLSKFSMPSWNSNPPDVLRSLNALWSIPKATCFSAASLASSDSEFWINLQIKNRKLNMLKIILYPITELLFASTLCNSCKCTISANTIFEQQLQTLNCWRTDAEIETENKPVTFTLILGPIRYKIPSTAERQVPGPEPIGAEELNNGII